MTKLNKVLPPIRVSAELAQKVEQSAEANNISVSEYRRLILTKFHDMELWAGKELQIDHSDKKQITLRIPKDLLKEIAPYLNVFDSINSLVQSMMIALVTNQIILDDEQIIELLKFKKDLEPIGRNLNQLTRAVNYQMKVSSNINYQTLDNLINVINRIDININSSLKLIEKLTKNKVSIIDV